MADLFNGHSSGLDSPASGHYDITPDDTTNFTTAFRAVYIGVGGNVVVVSLDGTAVTYVGVPSGSILPVRGIRINSTLTTATSLVGLY